MAIKKTAVRIFVTKLKTIFSGTMDGTKQRPELVIKVFPKNYVTQKTVKKVLQELKKVNALILILRESTAPYRCPYPYMYLRRIGSSEKLPKSLKYDGDPLSDYFVTLKTYRCSTTEAGSGNNSSTGSSRKNRSGYVILAFKALDDDRTHISDKVWCIKNWTKFKD